MTTAFAAPAAAQAATVAHDGDVLTVEAAPGENNLLELERLDNGLVRVGVGADITLLTPATCDPPNQNFNYVDCDPLSLVVAALGDGDDTVRVRTWPTEVDLGPGNDQVVPGDLADLIIGGAGRDEVDYGGTDPRGPRQTPVTVTLDGQPNDGASGEGDNVDPGIEIVRGGTNTNDRLVGNDGAQELDGKGGNDVLEGAGGDDILGGSDGDDVLNGGAGNDKLDGHAGSDRIDAGPGTDQVRGDGYCNYVYCAGGGPDEILIRDGEADSANCGIGHDRVTADPQDAIQQDGIEICEAVDIPPAGGPPPQKGPPDKTKPSGKTGRVGESFRVNPVKLARALRRGLDLKITCPQRCSATATVRVGRPTARRFKLGRRATTIGRGSLQRVKPGTTGTLKVRFTNTARKRLRRASQLDVTVAVTYRTGSQTATQSRKVVLRR